MIEFKKDGPFSYQNKESSGKQLRVIGLGQAGICVLDEIVLHGHGSYDLLAIDTDAQTLESSVVREKILLGAELTRGLGCGGELELAEKIARTSTQELQRAISGCDFILLTLSLGGGTGNALASQIVQSAQQQQTKIIVLATIPFAFEGRRRLQQGISALENLRKNSDAVLVFANDRLTQFPSSMKNVRSGFHLLNEAVAQSVESLAQILSRGSLVQLGFADIRSLFGRYAEAEPMENCWAASYEIGGERKALDLVKGLLSNPLLSREIWEQADNGLVSLTGGKDLGLGEVQKIMEELQHQLPSDIPLATGAHLEENFEGKLRLTLLLAKTKLPEVISIPVKEAANETAEAQTQAEEEIVVAGRNKKVTKEAAINPLLDETEEDSEWSVSTATSIVESEQQEEIFEEETTSSDKSAKPRKHLAKQEELPFESGHRGRFEKSFETIYNGENLDQPTFRRRKLQIRL